MSLFAQAESGAVAQGSVTLPPRGHRAFALTEVVPVRRWSEGRAVGS